MMIKNFLLFTTIFILISTSVQGVDFPMLPLKISPKTSNQSNSQNFPQNNVNYNNYNFDNQDGYYNSSYCRYNCLYSTTLTTDELRAKGIARRQTRLKIKCQENKAKKSKCEKLMED